MEDPHALNIYTDGSALTNPGDGGIGVRFVFPEAFGIEHPQDFRYPGYKGVGIGQMELRACITALNEASKLPTLRKASRIVIHCDSSYVVDGYPRAKYTWPQQQWRSVDGKPILNVELWKELVKKAQKIGMGVEIKWVRGHSKNQHNRAVDQLAKQSASNPMTKILGSKIIRKKTTTNRTVAGSIKSLGQTIAIRVVESEYLKEQGVYKLRAQVVSKNSKFFNKIDFVFSDVPLRPGHSFLVSLKRRQQYCEVSRVLEEIA